MMVGFVFCFWAAVAVGAGDAAPPAFQVVEHVVPYQGNEAGVQVRVLVPSAYQWDDETYTTLYVMDDSPDAPLVDLVESILFIHDEVLPILVVRIPLPGWALGDSVSDRDLSGWLDFLEQWLFPYVESSFRVRPFRILAGDQLTATMALTIAGARPILFHGLIAEAGSSNISMEDRQLFRGGLVNAEFSHPVHLFVSCQPEANDAGFFRELAAALEAESVANVQLMQYGGAVTPDQRERGFFLEKGLTFCFSDWYLAGDLAELGLSGLRAHYQELGQRYSVDLPVPKSLMDRLGVVLYGNRKTAEAVAVFEQNVAAHPRSASAMAALAEIREAMGEVHRAVVTYKKAIVVARETGHPWLSEYQRRQRAANKRLMMHDASGFTTIQRSEQQRLRF